MALSNGLHGSRAKLGALPASPSRAAGAVGKPKGALAHMRETLFAPVTDAAPFRGFKAPTVEPSFPHRVRLKELRLPRLPGLHEGPAPIRPRRDGAPRHGTELAILDHRAREAAALDSMWLAGFVDAEAPRGSARAKASLRRRMEDAEEDAKISSEFQRLLNTVKAWRKDEAGASGDIVDETHPLVKENARILAVLLAARKRRGAAAVPMRSTSLDRLLLLQRLEVQAAIILQRAFRRTLRRRFWRRFTVETKAVSTIQRVWYGHAERMRYQRHRAIAHYLALRLQSWWRGTITRREVKEDIAFHHAAAVDVQRVFRGHSARKAARAERDRRKIVRLQAWWRGVRGRARADRMYFDELVTRIQTRVRVYLSRSWYRRQKERFFVAATSLQRAVRGYLSRRQRNQALWELESSTRKHVVRIMVCESRWLQSEHAALFRRRDLLAADSAILLADETWTAACERVRNAEVDYVRALMERDSSAADADEELEQRLASDIDRLRQAVTDSKVSALFKVALPRRDTHGKLFDVQEQVDDMAHRLRRLQMRINDDRGDILQRDSAMERAQTRRREVLAVADERRQWTIPLVTLNGKPDLRARKAAEEAIRAHKRRLRTQAAQRAAAAAHSAASIAYSPLDYDADGAGVASTRFSLASSNILALVPRSYTWRGSVAAADATSQFAAHRLGIHVGAPPMQVALRNAAHGLQYSDSSAAVQDTVDAARATSDQVSVLREAIAAQLEAYEAQRAFRSGLELPTSSHGFSSMPQLEDASQPLEAVPETRRKQLRLADAVRSVADLSAVQRNIHEPPDFVVIHGLHPSDPRSLGAQLEATAGRQNKKRSILDGRRGLNELAQGVAAGRYGGTGDTGAADAVAMSVEPPADMTPGAFAEWVVMQTAAIDDASGSDATVARHASSAAATAVGVYGSRYLRTAVQQTSLQAYEAERMAMMRADADIPLDAPSAMSPPHRATHDRHVAFADAPLPQVRAAPASAPAPTSEHTVFTRVNQLVSVLSAMSGEAEVTQYGALLKPAMDGMSRMMMQVMASDATAGAVERVADKFKAREAEVRQDMKRRAHAAARDQDDDETDVSDVARLLTQTPLLLPVTPAPPSTAHGMRTSTVPVTLPAVYAARTYGQRPAAAPAPPPAPAPAPPRQSNHKRFYAQYKQREQRVADDLAAIGKDVRTAAAAQVRRGRPTAATRVTATTTRGASVPGPARAASRVAVGFDLTAAADGELVEPTLLAMASPSSPGADGPILWSVDGGVKSGSGAVSAPRGKRNAVPWELLEQLEMERDHLAS